MNTEDINRNSIDIDKKSTLEIVTVINNEDKTVAYAVEKSLPDIARAVDIVKTGIEKGGRLIYVGAGTSGRIAIQDAAECTVTYGIKEGIVTAIMAGGRNAVFAPSENIEDNFEDGAREIGMLCVSENDTVFGISASGNAAFVCGALNVAREKSAKTIAMICNEQGKIGMGTDVLISVPTGAEVISGSTRMKAGTAQKMVLNMVSTAVMVKLGRVSGNHMTYMRPTNKKLVNRAISIISDVCKVSADRAESLLKENDNDLQRVISQYGRDESNET